MVISPELERMIYERAAAGGYPDVESFLRGLLQPTLPAEPDNLTDEEFARLIEQLARAEAVSTLPTDFSRADIYADHD